MGGDGPQPPAAEMNPGGTSFFFAWRTLSAVKKAVLVAIQVGLKASSIVDFYMTKYQSKAQQVLSSAMGPLTQGLRRYEQEQQEE